MISLDNLKTILNAIKCFINDYALTLEAGDNITLTPDAKSDKITITATDTVYTHPSYTARTGVPTKNSTPAFGGTFKVSQPVSDETGHITAINSRTITIPSSIATTSKNGLMSASDKTKLDATTDYIVEQGTTGVWTWRKWASGIAEMWAVFGADTLEMTTQTWGDLYTASWMGVAVNKSARQYPFAFVDQPAVTATPMTEAGNFWIASNSENDLGTRLTHAPAYQCVRASSATLRNPRISYYVVGKYK